jgi:hypothetical protein
MIVLNHNVFVLVIIFPSLGERGNAEREGRQRDRERRALFLLWRGCT